MAALVAAIHFPEAVQVSSVSGKWRAGTRPAMTDMLRLGQNNMVSRDSFNVFIAVYMMASARHGTIYFGVTSHLPSRIAEHREGRVEGFTKRYGVKRLVCMSRTNV